MKKRMLGGVLWSLVGYMVSGMIFDMSEIPSDLGIVVGVALGALIYWDPTGRIWARGPRDRRRVRPINEVAAELDRNAPTAAAPDIEHA